MNQLRWIALCLGLAVVLPAHATSPEPVTLAPLEFGPARLVVSGPEGEETYDPALLEGTLETYRLVTTTPWREDPVAFEGVMLRDLLEEHGLTEVEEIRVTAENDYEVTIPARVFNKVPILIATRVDGAPHTRRARGPLQFVLPMVV